MSPLNREDREAFLKAIEEVQGAAAPARRHDSDDESGPEFDLGQEGAVPEVGEAESNQQLEEARARVATADAQREDSVLILGGFLKSTLKKALLFRYPRLWW